MNKILLNGVGGNLGSRAAKVLLEKYPHEDLIFAATHEETLKKYKEIGIETRLVDFNKPETLVHAYDNVNTVVLISMPFVGPKRIQSHKNAIDSFVKSKVSRVIYTSIVGAGEKDIDTYEVNDHVWTEAYIKSQPIHYLFMRNSQYAEAMVSNVEACFESKVLANNFGEGKMAYISRDDCAVALAYAAMSDLEDKVIDVNGAQLLTLSEFLEIASKALNHEVKYKYITDEEQYKFFDSIGVPRTTEEMWADTAKNFPFCSDGMVTFGKAIRLNQMSTFTNDFEKLVGRKPITVKEIFEDINNHEIGSRNSKDN